MMRLLLGLILTVAAWPAFSAGPATAAPLFRVELIVFQNLDPAAVQAEQWPANPGAPALNHAMELKDLTAAAVAADAPPDTSGTATPASATVPAAPAPAAPDWRWLSPQQLRLMAAEQKLATSGRYHPLLHVGWVQPLDSSEHGTPIHIYDGMGPSAPSAAAPARNPGAAAPPAQAPQHLLDGTFTLWRGRFLHADLDIGYRLSYLPQPKISAPAAVSPATPAAEAPSAAPPQPVTLYVRMTQSRRLRDGELHYLDHPLLGALVTVSPYEDTAPAPGK